MDHAEVLISSTARVDDGTFCGFREAGVPL
jgi:hypothetical protein